MHIDRRLRKIAFENEGEDLRQRVVLRRVERDRTMAPYVPFGEEREFAREQCFIVRRQHAGFARQLPAQQRVYRIAKQRVCGLAVERLQITRGAQIGQQQKAALEIRGDHARHVEAGLLHQARDTHKGPAILMRGRRIHRD